MKGPFKNRFTKQFILKVNFSIYLTFASTMKTSTRLNILFVARFSKMRYYLQREKIIQCLEIIVDFFCIKQYQPLLPPDLLIPSSQM